MFKIGDVVRKRGGRVDYVVFAVRPARDDGRQLVALVKVGSKIPATPRAWYWSTDLEA